MNRLMVLAVLAALGGGGGNGRLSAIQGSNRLLDWPKNTTPYRVLDENSWEFARTNPSDPSAGKSLPYYGQASPAEVERTIDLVWNRCKFLGQFPGESVEALSARIQHEVDLVIAHLRYKPTEAHEDVLRHTGNQTFINCNFTYGDAVASNSEDAVLLAPSNGPAFRDHPAEYMAAFMRQPVLHGVCGHHVQFLQVLDDLAGVPYRPLGVIVRGSESETLSWDPTDPRFIENKAGTHHGLVVTLLPTDPSRWSPEDRKAHDDYIALLNRFRRSHDYQHSWRKTDAHQIAYREIDARDPGFRSRTFVPVASDPTWSDLSAREREDLSSFTRYPRAEYLLAGAKGDDVFRVYFAISYIPMFDDFEQPGASQFCIKGFGFTHEDAAKPLDPTATRFRKVCGNYSPG